MRERDLRTLMAAQILFWMLRATGRSCQELQHPAARRLAGRFRLTPMYDVMSAYPVIGDGPNQWAAQDLKLAMALLGKNRHYHMHSIQRRHFNSTARRSARRRPNRCCRS